MFKHTGCSDTADISSGVPQGSLLGPLFFVLHVNYIPNFFSFAKFPHVHR